LRFLTIAIGIADGDEFSKILGGQPGDTEAVVHEVEKIKKVRLHRESLQPTGIWAVPSRVFKSRTVIVLAMALAI
jgi:hypothetical protein